MKKILSLLCCFALLLPLLSGDVLAVQTYTTSDEGLRLISEYEKFSEFPYRDSQGDWRVGYGTKCAEGEYAGGIGEEKARELLRGELKDSENAVNSLLTKHSIHVQQEQFDAMVSMTHTLGSQWIDPEYRFCAYLINGIGDYSEEQVVNAIATWCHKGTTMVDELAQRRLREAYLFLYGVYDNNAAEEYTYIHYNVNGGTMENSTIFYPVGQPYGELPEATQKGRALLGWYTADGTLLTGEEIAFDAMHVTARWVGDSSAEEIDYSKWVNPYSDLKQSDWFYSYVRELSAKNVVGGYPDGTFQSGGSLKTGEALKLILRAAGYSEQTAVDDHWASGYVVLARQLGCFGDDEAVDPESYIDRLSVARITARALGLEERGGASPFADAEDGNLRALYEEGILEGSVVGSDRMYYPDSSITRAEICAIVSRVSNWSYGEVNDPAKSGFVLYRDKKIPVLNMVPVCAYDKNLFVLDENSMIMYYNDPAYTTALGIDVSSHQGEIDWRQVAGAGVEFVMIRLGFRGYGQEGTLNLDKYFHQNLAGAKAAGLKVGVYFFSQAVNAAEAEEEAAFVLENLAGAELDYPVVYDWEPVSDKSARTNGLGAEALTDSAIAFCDAVSYAGYTPMIYYNLPVGYTRYDLSRLTSYDVWFAQYAEQPSMYYDYRIWQYTDSGRVPGIQTKVDMNIAFRPY